MKIYLVGGAIRDTLLKQPIPDRDWVVVGSTPAEMEAAGFTAVGKDFPVFLHPKTKEEYALARQERKSGHGYKGFRFSTDPSITLEQDLQRRDLTVNAMAMDDKGCIIDPYNGQQDIEQRQLRHVSSAFTEDPVRILRVARFTARYHTLGFTIAPETQQLMYDMVRNGEVDHLTAERVWKEFVRAIAEPSPHLFVDVLRTCGALERLMPELDKLFGIPQPKEHHPEIDTGLHALLCLQRSAELTRSTEARFACLLHDLGKAKTPVEQWPAHHGHEKLGLAAIIDLCKRFAVPNQYRDLALLVCEFHTHSHRALELRPKTLLGVLEKLDAYRRPERFELFCLCCQADAQGRTGLENTPYPQADYLRRAYTLTAEIDSRSIASEGFTGAAFGQELHQRRLHCLTQFKGSNNAE